MIVIEIRIGRERTRPAPGELLDPVALATALRPRRARSDRWVWHLGSRGIAAAVASVFGVASLALVPGSDAPEASTVHTVPRLQVAEAAVDTAAAHAANSREIERMSRDLTAAALERVRAREGSGSPAVAFTGLDQASEDLHAGSLAAVPMADALPLAALRRQAAERDADALATRPRSRSGDAVEQQGTAVTAVADRGQAVALAAPARRQDSLAVDSRSDASAAAAELAGVQRDTVDAVPSAPVAMEPAASGSAIAVARPAAARSGNSSFSITRDRSAETQDLLADLHERASREDWTGVSDLLARLRAAPGGGVAASDPAIALTLAKWDARLALQAGDAAAAIVALASMTAQLDDEARALQAVAWLRTGAADRAVAAYRDLLVRRPDDARLWLGLGMALEAAAADPAAVRYAYSQTVALARDAGIRAAAETRLAAPQA